MILYHGSNIEIINPDLRYSRSSLDFGTGFYTTTDFEQAQQWAERVTHLRKTGFPTVSVFETVSGKWEQLSILKFESANRDWLDLVSNYRIGKNIPENYDVITGPVANDRTVDVINQFISSFYTAEIAL